jgi:hypothetical protein
MTGLPSSGLAAGPSRRLSYRGHRDAIQDLQHDPVSLLDHAHLLEHERERHASSEAAISTISRSRTPLDGRGIGRVGSPDRRAVRRSCAVSTARRPRRPRFVRTSCKGSKAAPGDRSRRRLGRHSRACRFVPARLASGAGRLARRQRRGRGTQGSLGAAADLTRGPLAAAPSGLCGRPGKAARSRASVQPPPPCQIRRSAGA